MKIKAPVKRQAKPIEANENGGLTSKNFISGQEVRWCPGCGDYSILKQMQTVLAAHLVFLFKPELLLHVIEKVK